MIVRWFAKTATLFFLHWQLASSYTTEDSARCWEWVLSWFVVGSHCQSCHPLNDDPISVFPLHFLMFTKCFMARMFLTWIAAPILPPLDCGGRRRRSDYICLRSRPVDPDVVCQLVSQSVSSNVETSDQVNEWPSDRVTEWLSDWVTEWPSDRVTKWPSDRKLRRRLTGWYIYIYIYPCLFCVFSILV